MRYQDINAQAIDRWVADGWLWGKPIDHQTYLRACAGDWQILLTPTVPVPRTWWPTLKGAEVLGLASGGGQQMPILAAAGARCTVLDYSPVQLQSERMVAEREGYDIAIVHADMTQPLPFKDAAFDVVVNPVSMCYLREVEPIWQEVARVLRPGGVLLVGLDTGLNYVVDPSQKTIVRGLPFDPIANPTLLDDPASDDSVEFSHTVGELLGGLLRAGLVVDDLYDDVNGEGYLSDLNIPTMLAVHAHKPRMCATPRGRQ